MRGLNQCVNVDYSQKLMDLCMVSYKMYPILYSTPVTFDTNRKQKIPKPKTRTLGLST